MDKKQRKVAERRIATIQEYKHVFNSEGGKKVLNDLMRTFHMLSPGFDQDPYVHAFKSGETNVVKYILSKMKTDTERLYRRIEDVEGEIRQEMKDGGVYE